MQKKTQIIATAGHVDHGKTSLVNSLTGIDTDTLAEEKRRGLTINLGYAYHHFLSQKNDKNYECTLGFVDVPGHIDFINNMLAGVGAVNFTLLVIAADDGIMPQTIEHLAIINLLGIDQGAVVITKIDRVNSARLNQVTQEITELIVNSSLNEAPLFPVSSITKEGIIDLLEHLKTQTLNNLKDKENISSRHFRYLIDRAFSVKGIGTVVTGSLQTGIADVNNQVIVSRTGESSRIKGIHVDGNSNSNAESGERAALNIDTKVENIKRGDWLLDQEIFHPVTRIDTTLTLINEKTLIKPSSKYHLYIGTSHHIVNIRFLDKKTNLAQIKSQKKIIAHHGDRFVLRDPGAQVTLGGGKILDIFVPRKKRASEQRIKTLFALEQEDKIALIKLLEISNTGIDLHEFAVNRNLKFEKVTALLTELEAYGIEFLSFQFDKKESRIILLENYFEAYKNLIVEKTMNFQEKNINLQGISETALSAEIGFPGSFVLFHSIVQHLIQVDILKLTGTLLHLPNHKISLSEEDKAFLTKVKPFLEKSGNVPPRTRELVELTGIPLSQLDKILRQTSRSGSLIKVADNRYYLPETIMHLAELTEQLMNTHAEEGGFSVIQFRDETGIGRNLCIEILEYFDRVGFTRRDGNTRILRTDKENIFG